METTTDGRPYPTLALVFPGDDLLAFWCDFPFFPRILLSPSYEARNDYTNDSETVLYVTDVCMQSDNHFPDNQCV